MKSGASGTTSGRYLGLGDRCRDDRDDPTLRVVLRLLRAPRLAARQRAESFAQGMGGMGRGGMGQPQPAKPAPKPNEPVTHAASGASDDTMRLGGSEPTLPPTRSRSRPKFKNRSAPTLTATSKRGASPKRTAPSSPPTIPRRAANTASRRCSRCGSSANNRTIAPRSTGCSTTTGAAPSTTPTCSFRCSGTCATTRATPPWWAPSCTAKPPASTTTGWPRSSSVAPERRAATCTSLPC